MRVVPWLAVLWIFLVVLLTSVDFPTDWELNLRLETLGLRRWVGRDGTLYAPYWPGAIGYSAAGIALLVAAWMSENTKKKT